MVWVDVVGFRNDMADNEEFTLLVSWFCWFHLVSIQKRKFRRCTLYACSLIVFTPPSCSMLFSFALSRWHFVVGHGIDVENNRM